MAGFTNREYDAEITSVALPALCGMLLDPVMGAINSALIGQLGTHQLGAVSVGSLAVSFCTFMFSFLLFLTVPEIAAAVAKKDKARVSKVAAKALWVGLVVGSLTTAATVLGAETIIAYLAPPEPEVAVFATQFIKVRAFGIAPTLLSFVAIGVFRGHRDTMTPLYASIGSAFTSLFLNAFFLYVLQWGVWGSALASTLASLVSMAVLGGLLINKGMLRVPDLLKPPLLEDVQPVIRAGMPLMFRNLISFGMVLYASLLCVRAGSVYQASFEVVRLLWILSIQFFECLNVATQALCAGYLGDGEPARARAVMLRLAFVSAVIGGGVGLAIFAAQEPLVRCFTKDTAVVAQVLATLPMITFFLPLDAVASIMDGSLMAAKQTDYLSVIQIGGAGVQYFALIYLATNSLISALSIWSCLKVLTLFRLGGGFWRNFLSPKSAYLLPVAAADAEQLQQQQQQLAHAVALADSMDADCGGEPLVMLGLEPVAAAAAADAPQGQAGMARPE